MKHFIAFTLLLTSICLNAQDNFQSLYQHGESYRVKGLYLNALPYYERAEALVKTKSHKLALWRVMAESYKEVADYNRARSYYERILDTFKEFPYKNDVLLNLSDLYILTGNYDTTINLLSCLSLKKGEEKRLINLSNAYAQKGNTEKALALLDTTIQKHAVAKDSIFRIATQNKGYILWSIKHHEEAFLQLNTALPLYKKDDADRYLCLGNLAIVESELGCSKDTIHFNNALKHINEAISWQCNNLGDTHPDYIISIRKKAEILLKMKHIPEATAQFKIYFEKEKNYIISNFAFMTKQERINFWNTKKSLLAECYATEGFDPDFLFDVAIFSKSVLLQVERHLLQLVSNDKEKARLYEKMNELRYRLRSATGNEKLKLEKKYELQERQLMAKSEAYKAFSNELSISSKHIRKALKNKSDRAIEFIQYTKNDTVCYAALILQKSKPIRFISLFTQNEIKQYNIQGKRLFGTLKEAIYSRKDADKDRLYSDTILGKRIWDPLLADVSPKANIYFSPEGLFHLLGIEYLCFGRQDCNLFRLSSTKRLCERKRKDSGFSLLLVGGLDYNDTSAVMQHIDTLPDRSASEVLEKDQQPPVIGGGYNYLNGSLAEVDTICTLFSPHACQVYKHSEGTEDIIKQEIQKHRIVHISTHGFCSDYQVVPPLLYLKDNVSEDLSLYRCGIILSGANQTAKQDSLNKHMEDGILSARELCELNLSNADLIVLSACQTGLGRITADGIAGLPRGLKKAGANSIIVSLWEVNDKATQIMMSAFYRYLNQGLSKQQALRKAQNILKCSKEDENQEASLFSTTNQSIIQCTTERHYDFSKPQYWAAFILIDGI